MQASSGVMMVLRLSCACANRTHRARTTTIRPRPTPRRTNRLLLPVFSIRSASLCHTSANAGGLQLVLKPNQAPEISRRPTGNATKKAMRTQIEHHICEEWDRQQCLRLLGSKSCLQGRCQEGIVPRIDGKWMRIKGSFSERESLQRDANRGALFDAWIESSICSARCGYNSHAHRIQLGSSLGRLWGLRVALNE